MDPRKKLRVNRKRLSEVNAFLLDPDNELVNRLLAIIDNYGGIKRINRRAKEAGEFKNLIKRLKDIKSPYLEDLLWLLRMRDHGQFISLADYRRKVIGMTADAFPFNTENAVTLEISSLSFFPWLIAQAKRAIEMGELMPGRYIRVRNMAEQTLDNGDILATAAAMRIIGASYVETLDTKGTDGSNVHLGGPETITGYFGGVGQPNRYALKWAEEFLHYYTTYGIKQVLNVNSGTVMLGYLMYKIGIDIEFKISVFMGNDNPYAILWTLLMAKLFSRNDGSTPLAGFNLSNSADNETIRLGNAVRAALGLEKAVRFEHHITETWKSIVRQPYNRRQEIVAVAHSVPNLAAKHEGGDPDDERGLEHPSDILDYFLSKEKIIEAGLMESFEKNYLLKHVALNRTAAALLNARVGVIPARNLHL